MKTLNTRDLPQDRLSTTDETGGRVYIHPADVRGRFHFLRNIVHPILLLIFLILPWIKINGHQALLFDIPHRRFALFGITFWAHDAPILVFVFAAMALGVGFITSLWGRLWCGWSCPQTVFVESLFRRIERWVEGDSVARRKLDSSPMDTDKFLKKSVKWSLFTLVTLVITHSFLAYFVGTDGLLKMIKTSPLENPVPFLIMLVATALVLFDFGWFREQFCTIVCPYGRFQSVLIDRHSLNVAYDAKRGEPRRGSVPEGEKEGDCVHCFRCVDVCPTGIDIRRGQQMECIACTACIDACDEVMTRLHRPKGLIRYESLAGLKGQPTRLFKLRTFVYLILLLGVLIGLGVVLTHRQPLDAVFIRAREAPYREAPEKDGEEEIINHFKVDLSNTSFEDQLLDFQLSGSSLGSGVELITPVRPLPLAAGKSVRVDLFVEFPKKLLKSGNAKIQIEMVSGEIKIKRELSLVGPFL